MVYPPVSESASWPTERGKALTRRVDDNGGDTKVCMPPFSTLGVPEVYLERWGREETRRLTWVSGSPLPNGPLVESDPLPEIKGLANPHPRLFLSRTSINPKLGFIQFPISPEGRGGAGRSLVAVNRLRPPPGPGSLRKPERALKPTNRNAIFGII